MKIIYRCEICGKSSMDKRVIEKCEAQGIKKPKFKAGDRVDVAVELEKFISRLTSAGYVEDRWVPAGKGAWLGKIGEWKFPFTGIKKSTHEPLYLIHFQEDKRHDRERERVLGRRYIKNAYLESELGRAK